MTPASSHPIQDETGKGAIGVFDSGYGGLTILRQMRRLMPQYDYIYLGDNARAPYGPRSFDVVYRFTLQAVEELFRQGCPLVILACNTASAKALCSIQQRDLVRWESYRRVLGVIRPTAEAIGSLTQTRHIGILATSGTIASRSYELETAKLAPDVQVTGMACPIWVPLVECGEHTTSGADYFVRKSISQILAADPRIDTLVLACTHYPLLLPLIHKYVPSTVRVVAQGDHVAPSLQNYLLRHPDMETRLARGGTCRYLTTESAAKFSQQASLFAGDNIQAQEITL
ncbi:MAG: glutamate racemase [Bacteroidales bacterium]|nr:glutamate racemase [Candidatus Equimonas faecalis]